MYNQVYLIGRLTANPKVETNESDKKVLSITLAVQRGYKNSDGIYETDFVPCILWDGIASNTSEYCKKGDLVAIRGQIKTNKNKIIEIIVDKISFLAQKNIKEEE